MKNTIYTPLNLPKKLVDKLKDLKSKWRKDENGKSATYETMIRQMIECHKKYGSIDITSQTIAELKSWRAAYFKFLTIADSESRSTVYLEYLRSTYNRKSMDSLIKEMMANNRRYLWWKKGDDGKEIVQRYKAIKLAKELNMQVSEEDILEKGQEYDASQYVGFTWVAEAADGRVYDKDWDRVALNI